MTNQSEPRRRTPSARQSSARFFGISVWVSVLILCTALTIGLFVTLQTGQLGAAFLTLFVVAVLVIALLTEPRGLFLTVASIPLLFGVFVILTSWFLVRSAAPSGAPISKTQIITSVYPLTLHFPVLAIAFVAAAVIAYLRITLLKRSNRVSTQNAQRRRRSDVEAERRNYSTVRKARTQTQRTRRSHVSAASDSSQVTVEELLKRRREANERKAARDAARKRARRSLNDDLYK